MSEQQRTPDHQVSREEIREIRCSQMLASAVGPRGHKYLELRFDLSSMSYQFVVKSRPRVDIVCREQKFVDLQDAIDTYNEAVGP